MNGADEIATVDAEVLSLVSEVWRSLGMSDATGRAVGAALVLFLFLALRKVITRVGIVALKRLTAKSATPIDDRVAAALEGPLSFAPIALGVYLAAGVLALTGDLRWLAYNVSHTLLAVTFFWAAARMVEPLSALLQSFDRVLTRELAGWIVRVGRIAIWLIAGATILEIWGVQVLPIIAGFGLLGIAVALGAQDLFKNLISGVLVLAEKRLRVGDWVKIDGVVEGTVELIGLRSTKVRRFDRAPVYVPNAKFADAAVVNFGEMTHRRIYWAIGLEYRTSAAQLSTIRDRIEQHLREDGRFLSPQEASMFVRLDGFAASSIDLLIYCFTRTRDWGEWLVIKEDLLLAIKTIVEEEGAGFAFPSQSVYLEATPAAAATLAPEPDDRALEPTRPKGGGIAAAPSEPNASKPKRKRASRRSDARPAE